ncbi:hypothetical protein PHYSODRAFT_262491 [Phytophthora sojae]|uniref:Uncharacterized protein n=1 Tax=Phytophthora sojae (strain P6497) TaxID=1094619 RepID=G4ZGR1_PHYSP|nr:hypothetical protein PHYSODRAFT_262491 [Phytophthora sojae]EGZ17560.1 hypothetical protein PHYSODRAFT_262491 [Phytophthora sojae]|eukprot:XP_009526618.1 hypothetical protein PHYSODRAFT_262491 [Phytophthora sojae]
MRKLRVLYAGDCYSEYGHIICGRHDARQAHGLPGARTDFLERALHYRLHNLSAAWFLSYLHAIDASSSTLVYGIVDVPGTRHLPGQASDAFDTLDSGNPNESTLKFGVVGVLALCVPFVRGDCAVGSSQSKMISKATESMQSALERLRVAEARVELQQRKRCVGDNTSI